ncbi:MAG: hypothetical protein ABI740_09915 [Alphaproteobacteria bacterium]
MAVAWPDGVPYVLKRDGASFAQGETVDRSNTDSGLARQRAMFTAAPDVFAGVLKMSKAQLEDFIAFRRSLQGAVFTWPSHPLTLDPVDARFIAKAQGPITMDGSTARFVVPVQIEVLP